MKTFLLLLLALSVLALLLSWVVNNIRCPHCKSEEVIPLPAGALQWSCLACKKDFTLGQ